jgi:dolichyl-diphosphooligosaccharide--protein glycosyltransferase
MQIQNRLIPFLKWMLVFLAISFLALYFRTYALHGGLSLSFRSPESIARDVVDQAMRTQVQKSLERDLPLISSSERDRLVSLRVQRLKEDDQAQYRQAIQNVAAGIEKTRHMRQPYLLEADPYHYLYQTERLLTTGRIADVKKGGQYLQPLMRAPHGHWEAYSFHPYVGLFCYQAMRILDPKISLAEAVAYVPLILTLVILLAYGGLGRVLGFPLAASALGMMILVLSPIFIQRSALGWYDTDPYNYIFPVLILATLLGGVQHPRKYGVLGAIAAAFLTGLYALFWTGWPFILVLVPGCFLTSLLLVRIFLRAPSSSVVVQGLRFLGIYIVSAAVFLAIFLTPEGLLNSIRIGWTVLNKFALAEFDIWPNIFLTVGEANGIGLKKLIFLTGNYLTFGLALVGVFWEGWRTFKRKDFYELFRYVFLVVFSIPILFMSLKTERFSVLFVLPLAIFAGFGFKRLLESWESRVKLWKVPEFLRKTVLTRAFAIFLILLVFLPMMFLSAHVVAAGIKPIMDDVWNEALVELRAKTPSDAIIDSWWPPGYFITAVAHRAVIGDGGTQHFHETYWVTRALITEDEREAAGIFRMLNLSGNDALDFLQQRGMSIPDAIDLISKIVRLRREEAFPLLPAFMDNTQKNELLDKTHGRGSIPPSYVLVYNDLIEQNLAVSVMARWDFRKAQEIRRIGQRNSGGVLGILGNDAGTSYVHELLKVSGELLKYANVSPQVNRQGNLVLFKNGVRINLETKDALIGISAQGTLGHPASFFYVDQGKLVEKKFTGYVPDVAVLLVEDAGVFYCVVADARLIRSVLFRLYYLKGQGMTFFKPLLEKGSLASGTVVRVFEIERDRFLAKV